MIDSIFKGFGIKSSLLVAEVASKFGDSKSMVAALEEAVVRRLEMSKSEPEIDRYTLSAGLAFYNLAKTLDGAESNFHRDAARLSLHYSLQHYNDLSGELVVEGGSLTDLEEYIQNPSSSVSLKDIKLDMKESH